jgi:hypothetical protein
MNRRIAIAPSPPAPCGPDLAVSGISLRDQQTTLDNNVL